jgi:hypothetical protein
MVRKINRRVIRARITVLLLASAIASVGFLAYGLQQKWKADKLQFEVELLRKEINMIRIDTVSVGDCIDC